MTAEALVTYLNDHWAGSAAGLDLAEHLASTAASDEERELFATLRDEIAADRDTLRDLVEAAGGRPSNLRELGGWLAERAGRLKLALDDEGEGRLRQFESLELLMLGIHGKHSLWQALHAAQPRIAAFAGKDFIALAQRAADQRDRVEAQRLFAARATLADA